jgi:hypothetical protein
MSENFIKIKETKIYLDDRIQVSKKGNRFRLSSIEMDCKVPKKWNNDLNKFTNCWIYRFRYLDTDGFFAFYFDYNNKFLYKL